MRERSASLGVLEHSISSSRSSSISIHPQTEDVPAASTSGDGFIKHSGAGELYPTVANFPLTQRRKSSTVPLAPKRNSLKPEQPSLATRWLSQAYQLAGKKPKRQIRSRTRVRRVLLATLAVVIIYWILTKLRYPYDTYLKKQSGAKHWYGQTSPAQSLLKVSNVTSTYVAPPVTTMYPPLTPSKANKIDTLLDRARLDWQAKIDRQSKTVQEAITEYKRRYQMDPPDGFEHWVFYAQDNGIQLVDEYDSLMESLMPFRKMDPAEINRRTEAIGHSPSFSLLRVQPNADAKQRIIVESSMPTNKTIVQKRGSSLGGMMGQLLELSKPGIKSFTMAVNEIADPRILLSWETKQFGEDVATPAEADEYWTDTVDLMPTQDWGAAETTKNAYARSCDPTSKLRKSMHTVDFRYKHFLLGQEWLANSTEPAREYKRARLPTRGQVPAVQTRDHPYLEALSDLTQDALCNDPEILKMHGLFYSDWRTTDLLYPVFSHSTIPGFSDILIPNNRHADWPDVWDREPIPDWEDRSNRLYWRGSADGGGNRPSGRQLQYQRQRFVEMVNNPLSMNGDETPNQSKGLGFAGRTLHTGRVEHMDVAFDSLKGCGEAATCEALAAADEYRTDKGKVIAEFAQVKMTVDIDGNAYSPRFNALMAGGTAVVKSTIYKEFFSDHIQAWKHFIPMSLTYTEFPSIFTYFFGKSKSRSESSKWLSPSAVLPTRAREPALSSFNMRDRSLQNIAESGREWRATYMGEAAALVYCYRLALEWGRITNMAEAAVGVVPALHTDTENAAQELADGSKDEAHLQDLGSANNNAASANGDDGTPVKRILDQYRKVDDYIEATDQDLAAPKAAEVAGDAGDIVQEVHDTRDEVRDVDKGIPSFTQESIQWNQPIPEQHQEIYDESIDRILAKYRSTEDTADGVAEDVTASDGPDSTPENGIAGNLGSQPDSQTSETSEKPVIEILGPDEPVFLEFEDPY